MNAEMSVGALQETVTVTGEAPIVDIRSSGAQMQVQRDTLEALPGTGRLALLNTLIPGASLTASTERSAGRQRPHADAVQRPRRARGAAVRSTGSTSRFRASRSASSSSVS